MDKIKWDTLNWTTSLQGHGDLTRYNKKAILGNFKLEYIQGTDWIYCYRKKFSGQWPIMHNACCQTKNGAIRWLNEQIKKRESGEHYYEN